jgi:hypothetical protein
MGSKILISNSLLMSKLANHIALFCSHDNTGYLVKYIDPVLGLDQNNSPHFK